MDFIIYKNTISVEKVWVINEIYLGESFVFEIVLHEATGFIIKNLIQRK